MAKKKVWQQKGKNKVTKTGKTKLTLAGKGKRPPSSKTFRGVDKGKPKK